MAFNPFAVLQAMQAQAQQTQTQTQPHPSGGGADDHSTSRPPQTDGQQQTHLTICAAMSSHSHALKSESAEDADHLKHEPDHLTIRGGAGSVMRRAQPPRDMVATVRHALNHNGHGGSPEASAAAAAAALPHSSAASSSDSTVRASFSSASPSNLAGPSADPTPTLSAAAASSILPQLPAKSSWFSLQHIHPTEMAALPEFFMEPPQPSTAPNHVPAAAAASSRRSADLPYNPFRTPQVYKDYRDWLFLTYHSDPSVYLHVTTCLKFLVADFGTVHRIHRALEGWELINLPSKVALDTKPSFLPVALPEANNS